MRLQATQGCGGAVPAFQTLCDMVHDGGGWALVAIAANDNQNSCCIPLGFLPRSAYNVAARFACAGVTAESSKAATCR